MLETPPGPAELVARDLAFARHVRPAARRSARWPRLGIFTCEFADWDELVASCHRFGLNAVQLGSHLLERGFERPELVAALDQGGIAVAGLAAYRNLIAPDERARRQERRVPRTLPRARAAHRHVCGRDRVGYAQHAGPNGWHSPDNRRPQAGSSSTTPSASSLRRPSATARSLPLEGSVTARARDPRGLDRALDAFPSRHLQVVLDPYNYLARSHAAGCRAVTRDFLDRFEHRFVLAHLKDVVRAEPRSRRRSSAPASSFRSRTSSFCRRRRPDLPVIIEHLPLDHVPGVVEQVRGR